MTIPALVRERYKIWSNMPLATRFRSWTIPMMQDRNRVELVLLVFYSGIHRIKMQKIVTSTIFCIFISLFS